jgi:hypothetical protein
MAQKPINLKRSPVLKGILGFKLHNKCVEQYQSIVSCVLNKKTLILNNFCKFNRK